MCRDGLADICLDYGLERIQFSTLHGMLPTSRGGLITTSVIGDFCCFNVKMTFQHEYAILGLNERP